MKISSAKMMWQLIALASIASMAFAASLCSCKRAVNTGNEIPVVYNFEHEKLAVPAAFELPLSWHKTATD